MEYDNYPFAPEAEETASPLLLNADLTILLGDAANACYLDFANKSFHHSLSKGAISFHFHSRFYGLDTVPWGSGNVEKFGLIYTDSQHADTILIAFRGTASILDALKDLESIGATPFIPYKPLQPFPSNVHVGDGFFDIYSQSNGSLPESMQAALFRVINQLNPQHIIITGHSLGCPLGSLFALDVAVCKPTQISNINFASPRVGQGVWQTTYDHYVNNGRPPNGARNETIRIVNNYDYVPTVPPSGFPTYFTHVGREFPVSFTVENYSLDWPAYILSWHSLNNYQTVVNNAVIATPQGWSGTFPDAPYPSWQMRSYNPFQVRSNRYSDLLKGEH